MEKKAGVNYGPPGTKHLIYFVDDLNMPKLDPYETAMPISLMRQHLGWGHWYDRVKLTQKNINNTQYVACMNPTAGSFVINPRLQRLFMTLAVDFPGQDSLMKIYGTFLQVGGGMPDAYRPAAAPVKFVLASMLSVAARGLLVRCYCTGDKGEFQVHNPIGLLCPATSMLAHHNLQVHIAM